MKAIDVLNNIWQVLSDISSILARIFSPNDGETLDIRQLCDIQGGMTKPETMLTIAAKNSEEIVITHYAIFTDAEDQDDVEFFVNINGSNKLRYHGVPNDNNNPTSYKLNLGLTPDLGADSLIPCNLTIKPSKKMVWQVINRNPKLVIPMGVRVKGYVKVVGKRVDKLVR